MVYFKVFVPIALMCLINYAYCTPDDTNNHKFYDYAMGAAPKESIDACLNEVGMTVQELHDHQSAKEPTEKCLCFVKCMATNSGRLGEDGTPNIAQFKAEFPDKMKDQVDSSIACLEKLGKITTCAAMGVALKCFPKPQ